MESRFGHDFSKVRVHTQGKAAESAQALNALAYTVGSNIVMGKSQYAPATKAGQQLLAHELAHTIQQEATQTTTMDLEIADSNDPAEVEARSMANDPSMGHSCSPGLFTRTRVFRQTSPSASLVTPDIRESFVAYIDNFESAVYDVDYRHEGGNLSKWLRLKYSDGTVIDIYLDNIIAQSTDPQVAEEEKAQGYIGAGGRIFPRTMNPATTPRLWEAKRSAIEAMEEYNLKFMEAAFPAVWVIIVAAGMPIIGIGGGARATRTPIPRISIPKPSLPAPSAGFQIVGQLKQIWENPRLFLNWLKNTQSLSRITNPLSEAEARQVIANADKFGLLRPGWNNPAGLKGLEKTGQWAGIAHFKVGNVHIPVVPGFTP
jgi:hypothetical protein